MSDYLSALVNKNLSQQENLRPRPRMRFEPSAREPMGLAQTGAEQTISLSPLDSPPVPFQDSPSRQASFLPQLETSPAALGMSPTGQQEQVSSANQGPSETRKVKSQAGPHSDSPYRGRMDIPSRTGQEFPTIPPENNPLKPANRQVFSTTGPVTTVESPLPLRHLFPTAQETGTQRANPQGQPPDSSPIIREIRIERTVEHTLTPPIQAAPESLRPITSSKVPTTPPDEPAPQPMVQETVGPALRAGAGLKPLPVHLPNLNIPNPAPPPAPTVNVTIGRIEIRAVPSPVTPPRRPTPQPKLMSLDDYLQDRSNGGRR